MVVLRFSLYWFFSPFTFIPQFLRTSIRLLVISCNTFPPEPITKGHLNIAQCGLFALQCEVSKPFKNFLGKFSFVNLRIGGKQNLFHSFSSLYCSCIHITLWSMYNLLISVLSWQPIAVSFRICINDIQFPQSNAFYHFM
jgi:hypothetical protein